MIKLWPMLFGVLWSAGVFAGLLSKDHGGIAIVVGLIVFIIAQIIMQVAIHKDYTQ